MADERRDLNLYALEIVELELAAIDLTRNTFTFARFERLRNAAQEAAPLLSCTLPPEVAEERRWALVRAGRAQ